MSSDAPVGEGLLAEDSGRSPEPRIPWGRMTALQLGAGGFVGFGFPMFVAIGAPGSSVGSWFVISLMSGLVSGLFGAGPPLIFAQAAHGFVSRRHRNRWHELAAVAIGALLGSLIVSLLVFALTSFSTGYPFLILPVIGVPSALGFAAWVLAAWAQHLRSTNIR